MNLIFRMTEAWLEVFYNGESFDIRVKDVDLMQIMDLIDELREQSAKQRLLIPDMYDMYYKSIMGKKMYLRSDMDLVAMFICEEGEETISLWLEDTINPIKQFALNSELRRQEEDRVREEHERASWRERLCLLSHW